MQPLFAQNFEGMEYIPCMILLIGMGAVFAIVAFVVAFFHRASAWILAGLAISAVATDSFLILMVNRWNLPWAVDVLTDFSLPPTLELWGIGLLSVVAALISIRRWRR